MNASADGSATRRRPLIIAILAMALALWFVWEAPVGAQAAPASSVAKWKDSQDRSIILRQGVYNASTGSGYGWAKVKARHAVYATTTVMYPTRNPNGGTAKGTKREYVAYALKRECYASGACAVVQQIPVKTVVENKYFASYWNTTLNASPGVLTTYCDNPDKALKCPSWVDVAFRSGGITARSATTPPPGTPTGQTSTSYDWSFEPVGAQ